MIRSLAIAGVVLAFSLAHAPTSEAGGMTLVVDSEVDAVDVNPGDGVCASVAGECTFRAAIQETNALPGHQTILLPAGDYVLGSSGGQTPSSTGDVDVVDDVSILGDGPSSTTLDGGMGYAERVLDIQTGAVTISQVALRNVFQPNVIDPEEDCGGAIRNSSKGELTASYLDVHDNFFRRSGGGICNRGVLNMSDSVVRSNTAAVFGVGGGLLNRSGGTAVLERLIISGNHADNLGGGGISNFGSMILRDSLVESNTSSPQADGAGGIDNRGSLLVLNSTITGNHVDGAFAAGGVSIQSRGDLTLINSTVTRNSSSHDEGGAISTRPESTTTLVNSIVESNEGFGCQNGPGAFVPPISGGHNIDGDGSCQLSGPGDLSAVDSLLGGLADNGGPTLTHALLPGSPAIDAADDTECPDADQRGAPRPAGEACDIGAYEAGSEVPPPPENLHGDIDCDGAITPFDALKTLQFVGGLPYTQSPDCPEIGSPAGQPAIFGDVDCDADIDSIDALQILRHIAALPVNQPPGCPKIGSG